MPGLFQVRLVDAGEPVLTQTRVDRFLSSPQRVDVGMISGEAGSHLGTLGNGAVAGDQDIDVAGGLPQPAECRLIGAHLAGAAGINTHRLFALVWAITGIISVVANEVPDLMARLCDLALQGNWSAARGPGIVSELLKSMHHRFEEGTVGGRAAGGRGEYLRRPDLGRRLSP